MTPEDSARTYAVMFSPPSTDERGTPEGADLIRALLAEEVQSDGYSYAAFGPQTRENLRRVLAALTTEQEPMAWLCERPKVEARTVRFEPPPPSWSKDWVVTPLVPARLPATVATPAQGPATNVPVRD